MNKKKIGSIVVDDAALQKAMEGRAEGNSYVGAGDNMVDFGAATSFITEEDGGKNFQVKLANTTDADVKININPNLEVEGYNALKDGEVVTGLTAKGSPRAVKTLLDYIKHNPTRLRKIAIKVDDADQLDEPIVYRKDTPWKSYSEEQRVPSSYQDGSTNNINNVHVDDVNGWKLSGMETLLYTVRAKRTVTLSFSFGASLDTSVALDRKAQEAAENVTIAYARKQA